MTPSTADPKRPRAPAPVTPAAIGLVLGCVATGAQAEPAAAAASSPALLPLVGALGLLIAGAILLRDAHRARRRSKRLAEEAAALAAAYRELETAKTQAEAKTALMQATLSGMSDGLMMLDGQLRLVQWNQRFAEFTGVPPDILRPGLPMRDMLLAQAEAGEFGPLASAEQHAEVERRLRRLRDFRSIGVSERLRPNGQALEMRRTVLPDGGFVTLYTDVTARRRAEAAQQEARRVAEQAVNQKQQFVAMVSHEIRAPLNAVISSLALLDAAGLTGQQRHLAETARHSGDMLLDLVDDLLDLSRIDAGRMELRPTELDLPALLHATARMFEAAAARRDIRLAVEIGPDVPATLYADPVRLRQILVNFLSNAVKFSAPGLVSLTAQHVSADTGPLLRFAVRDQGPRIPEQQAAGLFQPFARLDTADTAGTPGTGMGLAICERLARLMNATIGLSACPAPGTDATATIDGNEFWFALKLPAEPAQGQPTSCPGPTRRARVLLVEDVAVNSLLTAALLRREGHHVAMAASGLESVQMAATMPFDIIMMDLMMPGIDGREAARRIRALPGPAARVPILALTGSQSDETAADGCSALMNGFLTKPVRPAELFAALARATAPTPQPRPPAAPPAPPPPAPPLIDTDRLADLQRGLPRGVFAALVEQCLADLRTRLPLLLQAAETGEAAQLASLAHALAGMAGSYGLSAFEHRMRGLTRGDANQATTAEALAGMQAELDRSADLLRAILQAQAA